MAGGSLSHSAIGTNITAALKAALRGKECKVFNSDLRIRIEDLNSFVYSDGVVVGGKVETSEEDKNAITNPILVIEVLSDSTAAYDRGDKFYKYRSLSSFKEYVLIEQHKAYVDRLYRDSPSYWNMATYIGLDKEVELLSLGISIPMRAIYEDVSFENIKD